MQREILQEKKYTFNITELNAEIVFGSGNSLNQRGNLNFYDILSAARNSGISEYQAAAILARQLHLQTTKGRVYKEVPGKEWYVYDRKKDWRDTLSVIRGKKDIPFFVGQTTLGIIEFGLSQDLDPTVFVANVKKYEPGSDELKILGFKTEDLDRAKEGPAGIAGSAVLIHWDGIEEDKTLLRERRTGYYKGKKNIPGGHGEALNDVPSLRELVEETGLPKTFVKSAKPLGTADQVVVVQSEDGKPKLKRYLNLVWQVDVSHNKHVYEAEDYGWKMYDYNEVYPEDLTPIAKIGLEMADFI